MATVVALSPIVARPTPSHWSNFSKTQKQCETLKECEWTTLWSLLLWRRLGINKVCFFSRLPWTSLLLRPIRLAVDYRRISIRRSGKSQKSTLWRKGSGSPIQITWSETVPSCILSPNLAVRQVSFLPCSTLFGIHQFYILGHSLAKHIALPEKRGFHLFRCLTKLCEHWDIFGCQMIPPQKDTCGGGRVHQEPSKYCT